MAAGIKEKKIRKEEKKGESIAKPIELLKKRGKQKRG